MTKKKTTMNGKITVSSELSADLWERFGDYVSRAGYVKYRALEGAMKVFMALPTVAQKSLMDELTPQEEVLALLEQAILDDATVRLLSGLSLRERQSLIVAAKSAKGKSLR